MRATVGVVLVTLAATIVLRATQRGNASPHVVVDVMVSDEGGDAVKGLAAADFEVISDGQAAPVRAVSIGTSRLNVVLLIDVSASKHVR